MKWGPTRQDLAPRSDHFQGLVPVINRPKWGSNLIVVIWGNGKLSESPNINGIALPGVFLLKRIRKDTGACVVKHESTRYSRLQAPYKSIIISGKHRKRIRKDWFDLNTMVTVPPSYSKSLPNLMKTEFKSSLGELSNENDLAVSSPKGKKKRGHSGAAPHTVVCCRCFVGTTSPSIVDAGWISPKILQTRELRISYRRISRVTPGSQNWGRMGDMLGAAQVVVKRACLLITLLTRLRSWLVVTKVHEWWSNRVWERTYNTYTGHSIYQPLWRSRIFVERVTAIVGAEDHRVLISGPDHLWTLLPLGGTRSRHVSSWNCGGVPRRCLSVP